MQSWTVIAVPDKDGQAILTRTYAKRGIEARDAWEAISAATEPSAETVRALISNLGLPTGSYDEVRLALTQALHTP